MRVTLRRRLSLVFVVLLLWPAVGRATAAEPDDSNESVASLGLDDDSAWCAHFLGHAPFASANTNLRRTVRRVDQANGDVRLTIELTTTAPAAALPSILTDCAWIDVDHDQRYQRDEPASLLIIARPPWVEGADHRMHLEFDHLVEAAHGADVCGRSTGVSVGRVGDDAEKNTEDHAVAFSPAFAPYGVSDRKLVADGIDHAMRNGLWNVLRSNRACTQVLGTPVSEAPNAILLGLAGVAVVAGAGVALRVQNRRGSRGPDRRHRSRR